jgi:two-component system NtrC family sensor kinase
MAMGTTAAGPAALTLIHDIAGRLASSGDIVRKTADILDLLRQASGASEVSLWLVTPNGFLCAARSGASITNADELAPWLEIDGLAAAGIVVRPLLHGTRRLGALVLRARDECAPDFVQAFSTAALLLAPELGRAEHSRSVASEADVARRFMEQIIDTLPVGLYVIDREYRVKAWNRKRESGMQGVSRLHALGKTIFEILHRAPAEELRRDFETVFRTGRLQQFHMESSASGERRTYRISKIPMRMQDGGQVTHIITIGEDVTDWMRATERFTQSEKLAAIGKLASGVIQEVNAPLSAIGEASARLADLLDALPLSPPAEAMAEINVIERQVARGRDLVDGLVKLSATKDGGGERRRMDLNAAIEQTVFLLRHHERFKRLSLVTALAPELAEVRGNPDQLAQVFVSLLHNAEDAMPEHGTITIRTRVGETPSEGVVAEVTDEGSGVASEILPRIFEPFFTTKTEAGHTGLGLTICHSIIAEHGGRIEVDSAVGAGSTFRILLPHAEDL